MANRGATRSGKAGAPPKDLKEDAKARWRTVYPVLAARGQVDLDTLRIYCQVWARWRAAEDGIARAGLLTKSPTSRIVASPLVAIAAAASGQVRDLETRLKVDLVEAAAAPGPSLPAAEDLDAVTRRELASLLGVHMQTITKWEREGMPIASRGSRGKPSTYRVADVIAWDKARSQPAEGGGSVTDVARERARKERAQAILAEQAHAMRQRELVPVHEVEKAWTAEVAAVRTRLLALPATLADRLFRVATLEGVAGVERLLEVEMRNILQEMADGDQVPTPGAGTAA